MVGLDLTATLVTLRTSGGKIYHLDFAGQLQLFSATNALGVSASFNADPQGHWTLAVHTGVSFGLSLTLDDVIDFSLSVTIEGQLVFGSNAGDLQFGLSVDGSASASVPKFGLSGSIGVHVGMSLDLNAGTATIPGARAGLHYPFNGSPPTGIEWTDLSLDLADKAAPAPTVTAILVRKGPPRPGPTGPGTLQIRGSDASEHVEVLRVVRPGTSSTPASDTLYVSAATGDGDWAQLLQVPTANVSGIDIDLGGGRDSVTLGPLSPRNRLQAPITIPTIVRGNDLVVSGGSNDTLIGRQGTSLVNGVLQVSGTSSDNRVIVDLLAGASTPTLVVSTDNPQSASMTRVEIPLAQVRSLEVDGGSSHDQIIVSPRVQLPTILRGGPGKDCLQGGGGPNTIYGNGQDVLRGGPGMNTIYADPTDLVLADGGTDHILGSTPMVLDTELNHGLFQRSFFDELTLQFNHDVSASLKPSTISLVSSNGFALKPGDLVIVWDPATNTATLTFPGLPKKSLPDGRYTLTVSAGGITDASGLTLAKDFTLNFHVLTGDTNGDKVVNDLDLYFVWQNLLKPPAQRDPNADLNGDGSVGQDELALVESHYLSSVP
jgi:hypothetical protein